MSLTKQNWILRQNYGEKTYQPDMKNFILSENFMTCPWGGWGEHRQTIIDGKFNILANDQDRKFIEEMRIGDFVLIPFAKQNGKDNGMLVVEIMSDVVYDFETEFKYDIKGKTTRIQKNSGEIFRPIGRHIKIIREYSETVRGLPRRTLSKMSEEIMIALSK